jgi:hypothetical protein
MTTNPPIPRPEKWITGMRTADGVQRLAFANYVDRAEPDGEGRLQVSTKSPEGLLEGRCLPFVPPMMEEASSIAGFEFHWRTLDYVFGFSDPRSFPSLAIPLSADEQSVVDRYVRTARDLASSGVLNSADEGMQVEIEDDTDIEHVTVTLSEKDRQVGFATMLRQCDSEKEHARFGKVADILWMASERAKDESVEDRQDALKRWRLAVRRLQAKSLNQLLRDKLAKEEDMQILAYQEEHSPRFLLSAFDYGDLIHWDKKRAVVASWEQDGYVGGDRRMAFLAAAAALAHVYIGFAVLAETATSGPDLKSGDFQ